MDRRTFLSLGLVVPFALKSGLSFATLNLSDEALSVSFAADASKPKLTLWQTPRQSGSQMMGYVLRTDDGQTIVFDGGTRADADYLTKLLQKECGGKVDAWFLTHAHSDHCGALCKILEETPDALEIKALYYDFPSQEWLDEHEAICKSGTAMIYKGLALYSNAKKPKPNEVFEFGPLTVKTLNDYDLAITGNAINNSTITFRLDVAGKSILILGDLGVEGGRRLVELQGKDVLDCDFVQMAHHGQQGVDREFYEIASPSVCLWPTPDWLWENNAGKGPGTGPWKTLETRAWMDEMKITEHYVSKDGLIKLEF